MEVPESCRWMLHGALDWCMRCHTRDFFDAWWTLQAMQGRACSQTRTFGDVYLVKVLSDCPVIWAAPPLHGHVTGSDLENDANIKQLCKIIVLFISEVGFSGPQWLLFCMFTRFSALTHLIFTASYEGLNWLLRNQITLRYILVVGDCIHS